MLASGSPPIVQKWITNSPPWLQTQTVIEIDSSLSRLDLGEQAAITLAQALPADLLIIDERLGRKKSK